MDLWIGSGRLAFNHHQRTETAVCQSGHLWEQPAIDERREQIRMGLSLDEDPVVEQVFTCLQASHLNSEYSRLAGQPK